MARKNHRGLLNTMWKKIVTVMGIIIAIWLISPLPEVSIIVGFFGGKSLEHFVSPRLAWLSIILSVVIGWIIVKHFKLLKRIRGR